MAQEARMSFLNVGAILKKAEANISLNECEQVYYLGGQ
jgi:hypothetical protein